MLTQLPTLSQWRARRHVAALRRYAAKTPLTAPHEARLALSHQLPVSWDERGYLTCYPDVAAEVLAGNLRSGYAHWLQTGYAERRALPQKPPDDADRPPRAQVSPYWDEAAYVRRNSHVAMLVALGLYADGLAHFWAVRGRQTPALAPTLAWNEVGYLWLHPDVEKAVRGGQFSDGFAHWIHYGLGEGRALPPDGCRQSHGGVRPDAARSPDNDQQPSDACVAARSPSARTFARLAAELRCSAEDDDYAQNGRHLGSGGVSAKGDSTEM